MATVVDTLVTRYVLQSAPYVAGAKSVVGATMEMETAVVGFEATLTTLGSAVASVATAGFALFIAATAASAAGLLALGVASSRAAADLESVKMGLLAYAGSAEEAEKQLKRLMIVSRVPGLGFKETIQGSVTLQASGFDSRLAERALLGFGNALALVGRGREDLDGVVRALSQIASKGAISAEEINQLAERVPQIRTVMMQAFGTGSTEAIAKSGISVEQFIKRVIDGLERLPKAANTFQNSLENLKDVGFVALAKIGDGINKAILPILDTVSGFLDYINSSGTLEKVGEGFGKLFGVADKDGMVRFLATVVTVLEHLPSILQVVIQTALKGLDALVKGFNTVIDNVNNVLDSDLGRALGFRPLARMVSPAIQAGDLYNKFATDLEPDIQKKIAGFKNFKPESSVGGGEGGFTSNLSGASAIPYLSQIAQNTGKMVDIQRSALGGSVYGEKAFNSVNIGRLTRRSSMGGDARSMWNGLFDVLVGHLTHMNTVAEQRVGR